LYSCNTLLSRPQINRKANRILTGTIQLPQKRAPIQSMLSRATPTNPKPRTFIPSLELIQILDGNMLENQIGGTIPPHWTEIHKGYRVIHYAYSIKGMTINPARTKQYQGPKQSAPMLRENKIVFTM
jgi:hypothetical protein